MLAEAAPATPTRTDVIAALHQASAETGSNFDYLLDTAMRESSLKPQAKSTTSSATGLFQFVGQTWLGLIKQHGAKFGLGSYASAIQQDQDGRYVVDSSADRQAILALRNDPKVAALMEGEYVNESRSTLEAALGRGVDNGELYAAHFLGPEAACRLIKMSEARPATCAASEFPAAASANRSVFYKSDGTPKSVREVYDWAVKQPASGRVFDDQSNNSLSRLPIVAERNFNPSSADSSDWNALQLYAATGGSSLGSLSNLSRAPFAVTADVVDLLGGLKTSSGAGHGLRKYQ